MRPRWRGRGAPGGQASTRGTRPRRSARRPASAAILVAAAGLALSACSIAGSSNVTAWALFSNVGDLVNGAPVELADVPIGHVTSITLDNNQAKVTMSFPRSARVPAAVTAEVRRTTILGQRFIDLVPGSPGQAATPAGASPGQAATPGSASAGALLASGSQIRNAVVVPGIQQLVQGGAQVIGAINTTQLASLVQAGAQGFGNQGPALRSLLDSLDTVTGTYASQSATIRSLVQAMDQLTSATAPAAQQDALALANLARTTAVLSQQSQHFNQLLSALNALSLQGESILGSYTPQITNQLLALKSVSGALASQQRDLGLAIHYLPGHNVSIAAGVVSHYAQVLNDFVVCGVPNGGSVNTAAGTCNPSGPTAPNRSKP
ncbi:MAG: MlaD family protein [Acidimicrobiales bacterium]